MGEGLLIVHVTSSATTSALLLFSAVERLSHRREPEVAEVSRRMRCTDSTTSHRQPATN